MSKVNSQKGQVKVEPATLKGLCDRLEKSVAEYEDHCIRLQEIRDHLLGPVPAGETANKLDAPAGVFGSMERLLNRLTRCNRHCLDVIAEVNSSIGMEGVESEDPNE